VEESLYTARVLGFRGMQFNAVVAGNEVALHIYDALGFTRVGSIPGGFRLPSGEYSDMYVLYRALDEFA
jgi:RimJ/RimL family protein N-acetyltransferase